MMTKKMQTLKKNKPKARPAQQITPDLIIQANLAKAQRCLVASPSTKELADMSNSNESALEQRARRAARRVGLVARKSRWRVDSPDNLGGFMLVDPSTNFAVDGFKFDLTAEYVIDYCSDDE